MNSFSLVARSLDLPANDRPDPLRAILEPLLDGTRLAPRIGDAEVVPLLSSLAYALSDLSHGERQRSVVRLCAIPDPWEIGLERSGRDVLVSVFLGGAVPTIAVHERRFDGTWLAGRVLGGMDLAARGMGLEGALDDAHGLDAGLATAFRELGDGLPFGGADAAVGRDTTLVAVEPTGELPIVFSADLALRSPDGSAAAGGVLRADLLSLLVRGKVRVVVGEVSRELPDVFVVLFVEQLVAQSLDALEAAARGRALHRRMTTGGAICGVRINPKGGAFLTLGVATAPSPVASTTPSQWTFPAVDVAALAHGVVAFGRALVRSLVRRDRAQATNLRLVELRGRLRELDERLRETTRNESKINAAPESYRAFAAATRPTRPSAEDFGRGRLRFSPRWLATVPSIDLRSTFLCGDVLVVGATRELSCLDRVTGQIVWQRAVPRGVTVVSPVGLARLTPDGNLDLLDLGTGDQLWSARLRPRVGATASGAVVNAPGLPRLLIVSEGARHLSAVDLQSGEVRWRHAARRAGTFLVRRAGKLVVVASGEPALTALDVLSGEVVWRLCDPLRFASHVAVGGDSLLAVAGAGAFVGRGGTRLYEVDAWSGATRWAVDMPAHVAPVGPPLLAPATAIVATHGRGGTGLVAFDRTTGALRFDRMVCAAPASCMVVDDLVILNGESGELVAIDANDGTTRYRHLLDGDGDGDRPRRLEPVLRSGALFVPQAEVHVVRPRDGALLGRVPADLVPDLLRVDERCDVYVVEESGHMAAFEAAARLTLVQGGN